MLFQSVSILAFVASALAAPTSPPSYSGSTTTTVAASAPVYTSTYNSAVAPAYASAQDSVTVVKTLHTEVFYWTAAMNATRESYKTCTTDEEKAVYVTQLKSQFSSLQTCLQSAQTVIQKQSKHSNDPKLIGPVQECVQEIRYTGEGLIPILGHDVVAPLLVVVVHTVNGLLGVLLPLVGGLLGVVFNLVGGLLDVLF